MTRGDRPTVDRAPAATARALASWSGRGGFTLVELLVTMLILGLATPLMMGAIVGSLTITRQQSQDRSAATLWMQGEIEFLRRLCSPLPEPGWKVPHPTLRGEPALPAVVEGRAGTAPDAGYVEVEPAGPAMQRVTVYYYKTDWGPGPRPDPDVYPPDASTTTYVAEIFTGRCPP